jgi:hypothetical protein
MNIGNEETNRCRQLDYLRFMKVARHLKKKQPDDDQDDDRGLFRLSQRERKDSEERPLFMP